MKNKNDLSIIGNHRVAIMGFAALWILFFHEWILLLEGEGTIGFFGKYIKRIGFCGVDIFFLLSGMGLVYSIKKSNLKTFYFNRFKRISFSFVFVGLLYLILGKWSFISLLKNLFFYNFFVHNIYNFLWFVPAIFIFYLLFPLYYKIFDKSKNKYLFTFIVLCIWFILAFFLRDYIRSDFYGVINRIPIFLTGIFLGWFVKEKKYKFSILFWLFVVFFLLLGFQTAYMANFEKRVFLLPESNCLPNYFMAISITILLAVLFEKLSKNKIGNCVNNIYNFYGKMSFQFYCIQEFLAEVILLPLLLNNVPNLLTNIIVFVSVTIAGRLLLFLDNGFWQIVTKKK